MAGQNNQAGGAQPPHTPGGEGDPGLLALLSQLSAVSAEGALQTRRLPPAAVNRLLALLVEQQLPTGLMVITHEQFEQARERAYADGWQDALRYLGHAMPPDGPSHGGDQGAIPAPREPQESEDTGDTADTADTEATVLAFPPRIPLVRAADAGRREELMPHRPRPRRRKRPKATPDPPKN